MATSPGKESISVPAVESDATRQELSYRLRQQSLLGEFDRSALQTRDIAEILQRATELSKPYSPEPIVQVVKEMGRDGPALNWRNAPHSHAALVSNGTSSWTVTPCGSLSTTNPGV